MKIAVMGCGTVGAGLCRLVEQNKTEIEAAAGQPLTVARILERDATCVAALGYEASVRTERMEAITGDAGIELVVEAMGGTGAAYEFACDVLRAGKHLVTSNKDLIEKHGQQLQALADETGAVLRCEAAVGGAIPVISALRGPLAAERVEAICGILNGTTNFILTRMRDTGASYAAALKLAQQKGFAEADPTSDVGGFDAARKLAILSRLAFRAPVGMEQVFTRGIAGIEQDDIAAAGKLGYTVKLIAEAARTPAGISCAVRPTLVPLTHRLASVDDEYNAVSLTCAAAGELLFFGKGAGAAPTASAVLGDILDIARGAQGGAAALRETPVLGESPLPRRYYLRVCGAHQEAAGIGIVTQTQTPDGDTVMITQPVSAQRIRDAADQLMNSGARHITAMAVLREEWDD